MYVHTKYMLADPLGPEPVVVVGSANFSGRVDDRNDENMLVIRGNAAVADIYLGEFMRLFSHYAFRESLTFKGATTPAQALLRKYLVDSPRWIEGQGRERRLFRRRFGPRAQAPLLLRPVSRSPARATACVTPTADALRRQPSSRRRGRDRPEAEQRPRSEQPERRRAPRRERVAEDDDARDGDREADAVLRHQGAAEPLRRSVLRRTSRRTAANR